MLYLNVTCKYLHVENIGCFGVDGELINFKT